MSKKKRTSVIQSSQHNSQLPKQNVITHQQWSGPLPPPASLEHFNQIIPNGAERIIAMVEQEQAHRIKYESDLLGATIKDTRRGHWMGSAISFAAIGAAAYGIYMGVHPTAIIALVSLPIFAIIKAIVGNKSNSN